MKTKFDIKEILGNNFFQEEERNDDVISKYVGSSN